MKKTIVLISIALFFSSCQLSKYTLETVTPIIDFRAGKWLMNDIQAPNSLKRILKKTAVKRFSYFLNDRLYDLSNVSGIIAPAFIPLNPNKKLLNDLKSGTGFDYFINIKTNAIKNELGSIQIGDNDSNFTNNATITIEIYDLNTQQIIFFQKAFGSNGAKIFADNLSFTNNANTLILGGLEKIMKDIKKNSKY